MADLEIPDEVLAAQRAYDVADAAVKQALAKQPSGLAIAAGEAVISDEVRQEVAQARTARLERLRELRSLPWWDTVESPIKAEQALRKAARAGGDGPAAA